MMHSRIASNKNTDNTDLTVRHLDEIRFFKSSPDAQKAAIASLNLESVLYHDSIGPDLRKLWFWDIDIFDNPDRQSVRLFDSWMVLKAFHLGIRAAYWLPVPAEHLE
ncbi:hypothetical protein E8E12_003961 [Didymella heteroderae]|uniref:Uncharacterized protein n=1 Tax=Didymella heteroderae TaxID=1769908 RepID=A0A9P4WQ27_9PLEO|nr:hypothetical protein E8E12_003961 [Didymella heteroderae]